MSTSIIHLFELGSQSLGPRQFTAGIIKRFGKRGEELRLLLSDVNGFYAFESALHVLPATSCSHYTDLERWNSSSLWKKYYGQNLDSLLCFAEDAFGGQYCVCNETIWYFEPETGATEPIASTIKDWAKIIASDYNLRTGYSLAHQWQKINGPLPDGQRLLPKMPFVLGGKFNLDNLIAYDAIASMQARGNLAGQIRNLPDGSQVRYKIV